MTDYDTTQGNGTQPVVLPPGFNPARQGKITPTRRVYASYQPARRHLDNEWRKIMDLPPRPTVPTTETDPAPAPSAALAAADAHYDTTVRDFAPDHGQDSLEANRTEPPPELPDGDYIEQDGVRHYHHLVKCGNGEYRATNAEGIELADDKGSAILVDDEGRALADLKRPFRKKVGERIGKLRAKIDGRAADADSRRSEPRFYDANGVPIGDFDVPAVGKVPSNGRQYRGRKMLAVTVAGGVFVGAVGIGAGVYVGRSAVPAAGMISPREAAAYRLTTFPLDAAAAFGKQYLEICLTHGDSEQVKKREQLLEAMATSGSADSCGWTSGGNKQNAEMIVWNGSMRPVKDDFGSGNAAYLGYTVSTGDGQYYTVTVPVWVKSVAEANDFRVVGDIGFSSPPRVATPPPAESRYEKDSSLANEVRDSIITPFLTAWAASDKGQLNLVLADNAEPSARTGLGGAVDSPKIQSIDVLSPRKTAASDNSTSIVYQDGDKVLAETTVVWQVPASESKQVTGYRIELHRAAGKWQVYDIDGGLVDRGGGGLSESGIGAADAMVPGAASTGAGE